ncbi:MAG: hypothetical protein WB615_13140 [Candidatus Tumulicola sp.]
MVATLSGCGGAHSTTATINFGPGNRFWTGKCAYEGFAEKGSAQYGISHYGIFRLPAPDSPNVPNQGASISGGFSGFGERTLHNDGDDTSFKASIVFHAVSSQAVASRLRALRCFG